MFLSLESNRARQPSMRTASGRLRPGGPSAEVKGLPMRVDAVLPASGLLLKRDPGVPLVYLGFAVLLVGGGLSLVATRQLWAIAAEGNLSAGGLCNRNLAACATELPELLERGVVTRNSTQNGSESDVDDELRQRANNAMGLGWPG